jgi:4-amino-4-deoxy-L-arabinose transferase-like glycosyltransferase
MAPTPTDAMPAAGQARGLTAFAAALSLFLLGFRLLAGSNGPLFFDEAYYWQWSTNLQLGYFDHPPLIAYFIRAGTLIFGDTPLGIRLMPSLSATLCVLLVWGIARRLTGDVRAAAWAAILANLTGIVVLSFVAWPDEPMVLAWLVALYALVRVYSGGTPAWWLLAGVMIGVAGASKYIALFLALGLFAWTLAEPTMRRWYPTRWPWLALVAAAVVISPVLAWNAANGWPSLVMQTMRDGLEITPGDSLRIYITNTLLISSPPIVVLALVALVRGPDRLMWLTVVPFAIFLGVFSQGDEVGLHWVGPITYFVALMAGLAMRARLRWWNGALAGLALLLGLAVTLTYYTLLSLPLAVAANLFDPGKPFRGWPEAARGIEQVRVANGATYVVTDRYFHPGYLKLELGVDAPVFNLNNPGYDAEYGRWRRWHGFPSATPEMADDKAIFVGPADVARLYYDSVVPLDPVTRPNEGEDGPQVAVSLVSNPKPETAPLFNNWQAP